MMIIRQKDSFLVKIFKNQCMNKNNYLSNILNSYHINREGELKQKYLSKRDSVKEAIESYFNEKIYNPINSGSYAKHTIINTKFDFDLAVPFKYNSYITLQDMYDAVYDFFSSDDFKDDTLRLGFPRKQKVSIGLEFSDGDDIINIDVVPGREIGKDNYQNDKKLNLCLNGGTWGKVTSIQTSIQTHIDLISGNNVEREIIKLLKIWKVSNNIKIKSFLIELITMKAFEDNKEELSGIWEKLKMVMEYIRDNIETISLKDPANSNNVVTDTIEDYQKTIIKNTISSNLDFIDNNEENLKKYFPENPKFPIDNEDESSSNAGQITQAMSAGGLTISGLNSEKKHKVHDKGGFYGKV